MGKDTEGAGTPSQSGSAGREASLPALRESARRAGLPAVELLLGIPEEEIWLQSQRSEQTRRAYKNDVRQFVLALGIESSEELYQVDRAAIVAWVRQLEAEGTRPRSVRRKLSALSSLFRHLVERHLVMNNPVRDIKRPRVNRKTGTTAAFDKKQARTILDAPPEDTLMGLRDRALLSVGLQLGPRRSEIAHLAVKDFHLDSGFWALRYVRKGGQDMSVTLNPQTVARIQAYLEAAGHSSDLEGPLFRPLRGNQKAQDPVRHMEPDMVDKILRKWVKRALGMTHGFSAHSMRATFITEALNNGAAVEDVQRDVGHADSTTTLLYDRRGHNPERAAAFKVNY